MSNPLHETEPLIRNSCNFTLRITTSADDPVSDEVSVTFDQPLTTEEEAELQAWLIKVQSRMHALAPLPPFAVRFKNIYMERRSSPQPSIPRGDQIE